MDKQKEYLPGNRLLDKLKSEEIEALSDHLELLDLELRQVSYEANAPIDYSAIFRFRALFLLWLACMMAQLSKSPLSAKKEW